MVTTNTIKAIQDIMRKDTGVDGDAQRISQQVWMIFLKIFDDKETEYELLDPTYKSPIPKELRWRNWAADDEGITGDSLLDFVNNKLFPTLKNLPSENSANSRELIVKAIFLDGYNYMKSGTLMRQVINKINNDFDFNNLEDRHIFNDIYEKILNDLQSAGNAGEYYTPRALTDFIAEMVKPKLGERIFDPACGTGGFLASAIKILKQKEVKTAEDNQLLQKSIYGIDKKPLPHLLSITNMILNGIEIPLNIRRDNALSRPLRDYTETDKMDVILTNPPFGGIEEDGIENNFPTNFRTRETADLFLVLIIKLLKFGGRCGMVLPDGSLSGEGVKQRIRQLLLEECNLHTIIRLPSGVFSPYALVKTNLLFFEKGTPTKEVWFFEHPYPDGIKSYSKTKPIKLAEFDKEKKWWDNRAENEYAWKIPIESIRANNYNLDVKNPYEKKSILIDSDKMLKSYISKKNQIIKIIDLLKSEISFQDDPLNTVLDNDEILRTNMIVIKYLKETLLKLAIQGKFTSINKKINNYKNNWIETKIGNILQLKYGKGLINSQDGEVPVYGANGIKKYCKTPLINDPVIIVGRKGSVGALNISYVPCWPTDVTYYIEKTKSLDFKFIYYLLLSLDLPDLARGIKPGLNRNEVYKINISLPPLEEQKNIVTKINKILSLCEDLETEIKESKNNARLYMQSVLQKSISI